METKAHSEVAVAVPFEEIWTYADHRLASAEQWLEQARGNDHRLLRWISRRVLLTIERCERERQEIQFTLVFRFLGRTALPFHIHLDALDAQTTHVLCRGEMLFPPGLRGWLLRRVLAFGSKRLKREELKRSSLQAWLDSAMPAWANSMERTYQRFGNLAPESLAEAEKDLQKERQTEQKQS